MAYLNRDEREKLMNELIKMQAPRARGKLRRMDPKVKLAYLRNSQEIGEYWTRYELLGLGTVVTLVEHADEEQTFTDKQGSAPVRLSKEYRLTKVMVEPMPENQT
ncbi:MAG: hypothetical protein ABI700_31580 [Chloroflexota bacterium]